MEAGYKAFTADAFRIMRMTSHCFGMEPETVARLAQMRARVGGADQLRGTHVRGITRRDGVAVFWQPAIGMDFVLLPAVRQKVLR